MKKILIITSIIVITCLSNCIAQTVIPGGNVYGNWNLAGSPYLILGHILVPDDSTLIIDAGVTVEFQGHYKLFVNGRILATGRSTDTITFTVRTDSIVSGWWGIRFDNTPSTNDSSILAFCRIQYGNAIGAGNDKKGGAVCLNNFSKVRIANSLITNNKAAWEGGGIYCENNSSPVITDNIIINNAALLADGGGISIYNASPTISSNTISNNTATDVGGGICMYSTSSPFITNNMISNNTGVEGGGIYCGYSSTSTLTGNIIQNNTATTSGGGVYCYEIATSQVRDNTINSNRALGILNYQGGGGIFCNGGSHTLTGNFICNNSSASFGGGIFSRSGSPLINNAIINNTAVSGGGFYFYDSTSPNVFNCTVANNLASGINGGGGGLYCNYNSSPVFKNVIVYGNVSASGNGDMVFLDDNASDPSFTYSNVEGGSVSFFTNGNPYTGAYTHNINTDPQFVSPSGGAGTLYNGLTSDWSLLITSLCINAGDPNTTGLPSTDLAGNPRIADGIVDMGAYEDTSGLTGIPEPNSEIHVNIFPNPTSGRFTIASGNYCQIIVMNVLGRIIYSDQAEHFSGKEIHLGPFASGIYFIKVVDNAGRSSINKIIIQKD